jgi:hypothetical protein
MLMKDFLLRNGEIRSLALGAISKRKSAEALTGAARKSELKAVAEEARKHGYLLLARKATEMSGA